MGELAIRARGVSKYFGDFPALRNVDLEVRRGRILALLGRNGAGKTTMLRILAGLIRPTEGEVSFPSSPPGSGRGRVGVVGHGAWIYDELTGEENLLFFGRLYGVADPGCAAGRWLARVGLGRFGHLRASEYSRGMRQRLTIARAFLHSPAVLLLDEPWTALDDRAVALLSALILEAGSAGQCAIVCSHQLREAMEVADEVALLRGGRLAYRGAVDAGLRAAPQSLYERAA